MLKVVEIFKSIEGEGIRTGIPAIFIRLHGCNCRCSYCDTSYSYDNEDYREMTIDEILDEVAYLDLDRITLTGGEPLIHEDAIELIRALLFREYEVNIETNGSVDLHCLDEFQGNQNLIVTMDWKSISSGMSDKMIESNLSWLNCKDVLKFVVGDEKDLDQMRSVLFNNFTKANIFVSPVFGKIDPSDIVEYMMKHHLDEVRIQLQLHKIIWNPETRGV